jgi:O-antigen/teichoic acid export membrane protein
LGLAAVLGVTAALHYDRSTKLVIAFVGVAKAIETFSDVIAGHLQRFERLDQVSRALMIRGIISSASFVVAFGLSKSLAVATIALGLSFLFSISFYDFNVASRLLDHTRAFLEFSTANVKRLIVMSLPLGFVMTLASLNVNLPRYILAKTLGTSELGIFASLAYLLTAASLVVVALGQSVCTRMSSLFADQNFAAFMALLNKLLGFVAAFAVGGLVICTLLGKSIVSLLFRPEYAAHMDLMLVMVATAGINAVASFLGFGITAARQFRVQVPIMAATAITTLLLTWFLVPRFGILGAGVALLAASTIQACSSFVVLKLTISEKQSWL